MSFYLPSCLHLPAHPASQLLLPAPSLFTIKPISQLGSRRQRAWCHFSGIYHESCGDWWGFFLKGSGFLGQRTTAISISQRLGLLRQQHALRERDCANGAGQPGGRTVHERSIHGAGGSPQGLPVMRTDKGGHSTPGGLSATRAWVSQ